ncbi:MAG: hypothetical protein ABI625_00815, partial [bacterium]
MRRRGANRRVLLIASCALLSACHPGNEVARKLRVACDAGNAQSCHDYAVKLQRGEYTLRDLPRAAVLYDTA